MQIQHEQSKHSHLPLPVLLLLLTESELEDLLWDLDRDRGPLPGDKGALLGECEFFLDCPVDLCGDGCLDCEECEDRLRRWW